MTSYFAVVQKVWPHDAGRDLNKTYVHILQGARTYGGTFAELIQLAPWNDNTINDYIIEITKAEHGAIQNRSFPLLWDGNANLPKWQWNTATTERGSWSDPEDDTSTWQPNIPIPDDRWLIRVYDRTPGHPQAIQLGSEDMDEDSVQIERFIKLFNPDDTPNGTNVQNSKTLIGGKQMIFDFTNGEANFFVDPSVVGIIDFRSGGSYRVIGSLGENRYVVNIYGRTLRAPVE